MEVTKQQRSSIRGYAKEQAQPIAIVHKEHRHKNLERSTMEALWTDMHVVLAVTAKLMTWFYAVNTANSSVPRTKCTGAFHSQYHLHALELQSSGMWICS